MPISDDDCAKLEKCFNEFDALIRDFASRTAASATSPRLWAAKMRIEEARFHVERHFTQYDDKPSTIDELEKILNSEDGRPIHINPDGSITTQAACG